MGRRRWACVVLRPCLLQKGEGLWSSLRSVIEDAHLDAMFPSQSEPSESKEAQVN